VLGSPRLYRSLAVLVLALLTGGVLTAGARQQPERDTEATVTPWIETWAPEAVKAAAQPRPTGVTATYRIEADVLLPLGFTAIRVNTRRDVGVATARVDQYTSREGDAVSVFEFFAASDPDRAAGTDQVGFFWEAHSAGRADDGWTAYIGSKSYASEESTLEEITHLESHLFDVTNGLTTTSRAVASTYRVPAGLRPASSPEMYAAVRPLVRPDRLRYEHMIDDDGEVPTRAFLGAFVTLMRAAVTGDERPPWRLPFTYDARRRWLELESIETDAGFGRHLASEGWDGDPAQVRVLRYRVGRPGRRDTTQFSAWIAGPLDAGADGSPGAQLPLAFEYQPKAFLRLRFVPAG
jgi:hypothetical protein